MRHYLQHLNAFRCFEAAARHQSFTRAASELFVTQAAVSQQIRVLESALGFTLFKRFPRHVELTEAGERLAAVLAGAFGRINETVAELQERNETSLLLAVSPTFLSRWLASRLPRFWTEHPDLLIHIHHAIRIDAIARGEAEAAVVWVEDQPEDLWAQRLFSFRLSPVYARSLIREEQPLDSPGALQHYRLIHDDNFNDWERWLTSVGTTDVDAKRGPILDNTSAVLLMATLGSGVALGPLEMIEDDLRLGRLVQPFAQSIPANGAYWLVASPSIAASTPFRAFADFLIAESAALG